MDLVLVYVTGMVDSYLKLCLSQKMYVWTLIFDFHPRGYLDETERPALARCYSYRTLL